MKYNVLHVKTQPHGNHVQHYHKNIPKPRSKLPAFKTDHITPDHTNCRSVFSQFTPKSAFSWKQK